MAFFSYLQLIIGSPWGNGLIELQLEMGLQLLTDPPAPLTEQRAIYSPLGFIFLFFYLLWYFCF